MENSSFYERKLVDTGDGSHSIYLPQHDESYHSSHGAIRESLHVFIKNGLVYWLEQNPGKIPAILEMGFGTGLNAFLTWQFGVTHPAKINYTTLEAFPVSADLAASLNYVEKLSALNDRAVFDRLHTCAWNEKITFDSGFTFYKYHTTLEKFAPPQQYDLVFYDAFAPRVQPELWTLAVFQKLFNCMNPGAVLVTYCAKGEVKRNLKAAGFQIETLPGPPGKREMTRARK